MSRPNIPVIDCRRILQFASILIWLTLFSSLRLYFEVIWLLILRVWFEWWVARQRDSRTVWRW